MTEAIRAELDEQTFALVKQIAASQGRSVEDFAADAICGAAEEAQLRELARVGEEDFAAGRWISHEQMIEFLDERRRKRTCS
jgi:predicted transcriptional regulator